MSLPPRQPPPRPWKVTASAPRVATTEGSGPHEIDPMRADSVQGASSVETPFTEELTPATGPHAAIPRLRLREGSVVADKYELTRMLKRGGMGSVWAAKHMTLETEFAVKFMTLKQALIPASLLTTEDHEEESLLRARFEREAKASSQMRSPHVVQIFDYGIDRGVPYLVMELLEGEDLGQRIEREKRLKFDALAPILRDVADGLSAAHASGLVHRDLKPENIFVAGTSANMTTPGARRESAKILDFGVAKAISGDRKVGAPTIEGTVVGTPHYMSPEQAVGSTDIDHRSDIWSLGVIAFYALTGALPFEGSMLLETVVKICSGPIPTPSSIVGDLGPETDRFFTRALARDRDTRFPTAADFMTAFDALRAERASESRKSSHSASSLAPVAQPAPDSQTTRTPIDVDDLALLPRPTRTKWLIGGGVAALLLALVVIAIATRPDDPAPATSPSASPSGDLEAPRAPTALVAPAQPPSAAMPAPSASASAASKAAKPGGPPAPSVRPVGDPSKKPRHDVGY